MVRTSRSAGLVRGIALCLLLMVHGCQSIRTAAPAAQGGLEADRTEAVEPQADLPAESPAPLAADGMREPQVVEPGPDPNEAVAPVELVLRFSPGQAASYKATMEAEKSVEWLGSASDMPPGYADGQTGNYAEITFTQHVREVRDDGHAVLEIEIESLAYRGQVQSRVALDFDSGRAQDRDHPLAALIGRSYRLEVSSHGRVVALLDMESVRQAVQVGTPAYGVAARLFSEEMVRDRHEAPPLAALKEGQAGPGQSWSDEKSFSFGDMGMKGYERVYTLSEVEDDGRSAVIEMTAIPSTALAAELHKRQMPARRRACSTMSRSIGAASISKRGGFATISKRCRWNG
jgi:hypothetical protein